MKPGEEHGTRLNRRSTNRQVAANSGGGRNHRWTKDASALSGIGPSNQKFRKVSASVGVRKRESIAGLWWCRGRCRQG
jgi:hypothetical protein